MTYSDNTHVHMVGRLGAATVRDIELGRMSGTTPRWSTNVAMRAGTIAMLFATAEGAQLTRLAPDGTLATTNVQLPQPCMDLVATVTGYIATCQQVFVFFDETGQMQGTTGRESVTRLAATRGAVLAVQNGGDFSLSTVIFDDAMSPMQIFEGVTVETTDSGCNAGGSSSTWLCVLVLGFLRRRRRVRP
ncbi:MAG: hypothetical protein H0T89_02345 [Deltaproteobacteria bacterium]|nr:hypothetical protein [Deltaproteobacteria bacterium]